MREELVAAVDGGGTKTVFIIADSSGRILGMGKGGPVNALFVPEGIAVESVRDAARGGLGQAGFEAMAADTPLHLRAVYASVPGASREIIESGLSGLVLYDALKVEGDDHATFRGAFPEGHGVCVLAGTGSFAIGRSPDGRMLTAGGWGPLLGDEGSGYAIGLAGLRIVALASEGRCEATALTGMALEMFEVERARDIIRAGLVREKIAGFATSVSLAASQGDNIARRILADAGRDLGLLGGHILKGLGMVGHGCNVALSGGVSRADVALVNSFETTLEEIDRTCVIARPKLSPAGGALLLAYDVAGMELDASKMKTLMDCATQVRELCSQA
jgi:N-acetylglucosamine kinase-like BadF-type ATPase